MRPRYLEFLIIFFPLDSRTIPLQRDTKEVLPLGILFPATFLSLFFFSPLANEIESHFVVKRPDRPDGYYVVYNITMSIRGSEKMPPPTRLETLFSLSVPRNKETNI